MARRSRRSRRQARPRTTTTSPRPSSPPPTGPARPRCSRCSATLRAEGLTVGTPTPGSTLLPVSGSARTVSARLRHPARVGPPSRSRHLEGEHGRARDPGRVGRRHHRHRRTERPLRGALHAPPGRPLVHHDRHPPAVTTAPGTTSPAGPNDPSGLSRRRDRGGQLRRLHVDPVGRRLRAEPTVRAGPHRHRPDHRHRRVRAVLQRRHRHLRGLLRPEQPGAHRHRGRDARAARRRDPARPRSISRLAAVNAPSASIVVYEAPNETTDGTALDLYNRIASDDVAQVVTTSWGECEQNDTPSTAAAAENAIFERMAAQGQTMVAASGD